MSLSVLTLSLWSLCSSCGVLSRLKRLEAGAKVSQYSQIIECLCSWGQAAHVLELITDWLTDALPTPAVSNMHRGCVTNGTLFSIY